MTNRALVALATDLIGLILFLHCLYIAPWILHRVCIEPDSSRSWGVVAVEGTQETEQLENVCNFANLQIQKLFTAYGNALIGILTCILFVLILLVLPLVKHCIEESRIIELSCCPSFNIYASLSSLQQRRNQPDRSMQGNNEHITRGNVSSSSPHVTLAMAGSSTEEHQRDNYNLIYDCVGATEEQYEHLHGNTGDEHIYTVHIPQVMRDILAEMPPGMTAEDMLRMCDLHRPTQSETDDEFSDERSDYMEGQI